MVFPLSSYKDKKETTRELEKAKFRSLYIIDLRIFTGALEDIYLEYTACVRELLVTEQDNLNLFRRLIGGPDTFLKARLAIESLKTIQMERQEELVKATSLTTSYAQLISRLKNYDFYGNKEISTTINSDDKFDSYISEKDLNDPHGEKHGLSPAKILLLTAIKTAAKYFGQKVLDRIKQDCPFIYQTLSHGYESDEIVLIIANLPFFLYHGFLEALGNKKSTMLPLSQPNVEVGTALFGYSLLFPEWFRGSRLYLKCVDDPTIVRLEKLYPNESKVYLVNPTKQSAIALKSQNSPMRFLVISDQEGTRYFQCVNNLYHEVSHNTALNFKPS